MRCRSARQVGTNPADRGTTTVDDTNAWREIAVAVNPAGDTLELAATLVNRTDGTGSPALLIDRIEETPLAVTDQVFRDIDGAALQFVSAIRRILTTAVTRSLTGNSPSSGPPMTS